MPLILFDDTQFITFDVISGNELKVREIINEFRDQGFNVLKNSEIKQKKLDYLGEYFSNQVMELEQSEFLGEFEGWREKENIPAKVSSFANLLRKLANSGLIKNLKVILVEYASEDKEVDHIWQEKTDVTELYEKLFHASKSCFEAWGNVMIFCINNS